MEVNCEGCAGCCIDWRPLVPDGVEHERSADGRGPRDPLDDVYNLVPLTRDDVRGFLDAGLADATTPRLWTAGPDDASVTVDGRDLAAIAGRPAFFVGLRKPSKPVAPFGTESRWLPTCAFLDPATLQCRIHDADVYPEECAEYPGHNLALDAGTECERVEASFGGERLLDDAVPDDLTGPLFGLQALGQKVFAYPEPADLDGVVDRLAADELTDDDRARFVAAAAASAPGTVSVEPDRFEDALERARDADSWVGRAVDDWDDRAASAAPDPALGDEVEVARGAPPTPGWDG